MLMGDMDMGCHQAILAHLENHGLDPDKVREVQDERGVASFYKTALHLHQMAHELDEWRPVETQTSSSDDATLIPGTDVLLMELEEYVFEVRGVLNEEFLSIGARKARIEARLSAMLSLVHHLRERLAPVETQPEVLYVLTAADAEAVLGRTLRPGEASSIRKTLNAVLEEDAVDGIESHREEEGDGHDG